MLGSSTHLGVHPAFVLASLFRLRSSPGSSPQCPSARLWTGGAERTPRPRSGYTQAEARDHRVGEEQRQLRSFVALPLVACHPCEAVTVRVMVRGGCKVAR